MNLRAAFALLASALISACGDSSSALNAPLAPPQECVTQIADDPAARPSTIPALRQWQPGGAEFALRASSRILARQAELIDVAHTLADDLFAFTAQHVPVMHDAQSEAGEGDVVLSLGDCNAALGQEVYRLAIDGSVLISAIAAQGAFYGTRTLLQLLHQSPTLAGGIALDWPRYPERGMMVDAGRKYFTAAWMQAHVKELAYLKMNYLHLHFSDNEGFRIESESHPEIVSEEYLSKDEVRDLLALAQRYFVTVVPEIDMPGHMTAALTPHPELQLVNVAGQADASRLDMTKPEAMQFVTELLEEYLALFPGPYWHTGADEYMAPYEYPTYPQLQTYARTQYGPDAEAKDAIHGFTNRIDELVRAHGRTTRMWHDDLNGGTAVTVNSGIVAEWWTNFSPLSDPFPPAPQALLDQGRTIVNAGWFPTYYVLGGAFGVSPLPPPADMRSAYESWEVHQFYGPIYYNDALNFPPDVVDPEEPRNLGSKLNLWCDDPAAETEAEVAQHIAPNLRVIAQKTWRSPLLVPGYAEFEAIMDTVGHAPEYGL
jgi:hexosaminidase